MNDQVAKDKALQSMAAMSSAQLISATAIQNKLGVPSISQTSFPPNAGEPPAFSHAATLLMKVRLQTFSNSGLEEVASRGQHRTLSRFPQPPYSCSLLPPLLLYQIFSYSYCLCDVKHLKTKSDSELAITLKRLVLVGKTTLGGYNVSPSSLSPTGPAWQGRSIGTPKLRLVEFMAFMEQQGEPDAYNKHLYVHISQSNPSYSDALLESVDVRQIYDKFPEKKGGLKELYEKGPPNAFFLVKFWADLNTSLQDEPGVFYGVSSQYESPENMTITCSSKVCSFGKQVVEKVETEYARFENGRFLYRIHRSPMCEYLINFIHKLKQLPEKYMMNSVLENFTILQLKSWEIIVYTGVSVLKHENPKSSPQYTPIPPPPKPGQEAQQMEP
ncbi:unnamed protein product [Ranitomeya imitator]|uniref:YAP binding domain-containing protein n=1 Tax=Ranitomeya imitator TaxID=111125 RepID=A0ABN9L9K3_9NEOB|nr:unnamed protein product [Ranitomeya imitator]